MNTNITYVYRPSASRVTVVAHLFGILTIVLLLVWLLHYRGGIEYDSDNPDRVFNVHPFLMVGGFIFFAGEAIMAFKTVPSAARKVQKYIHAFFHLTALVVGVIGICAVFKYHDMINIPNMYSLHSWIGLGTFSLYCLQWLLGSVLFLAPGASLSMKNRMLPWHMFWGRLLLYMAICAALTGLMEKASFLKLQHNYENALMNFTGLSILLFGIFVDLSSVLAHYV